MQNRYLELLQQQNVEAKTPLKFSPAVAPKQAQESAPPAGDTTRPFPDAAAPTGTGQGHAEARPAADILAELKTEPEMAAVLQGWGADAADNTAYMAREATEILNSMPVEDAQELQAYVDDMSPAGRAKLYSHLADAGRARHNR